MFWNVGSIVSASIWDLAAMPCSTWEIADVIAGVDASMFVLDFVPNATVEQMRERADKFYTTIQQQASRYACPFRGRPPSLPTLRF